MWVGGHPSQLTEDTEDEAPRPPIPLIPDPLDEILKRHMTEIAESMAREEVFFFVPPGISKMRMEK